MKENTQDPPTRVKEKRILEMAMGRLDNINNSSPRSRRNGKRGHHFCVYLYVCTPCLCP